MAEGERVSRREVAEQLPNQNEVLIFSGADALTGHTRSHPEHDG